MDNRRNRSMVIRGRILRVLLFLYDVFAVNFAYYIAVIIRFTDVQSFQEQGHKYMALFRSFAPWYTVVCIVLFIMFRQYSGMWRYAGINDVKKLVLVSTCTCIFYVFGSLLIVGRMPISIYVLGAGIQFILICLSRMAPRYVLDSFAGSKSGGDEVSIPLMIIGIGENARIIQNKIARDGTNIVRPVCIVDYSYAFSGDTFNGLPVHSGQNALKDCIEKYDIRCVIIADDNLPEEYHSYVRRICEEKDIELRDFVIEAGYRARGVSARNLIEMTEGPVKIISEPDLTERDYENSGKAVSELKDNCIVKKVSVDKEKLVVYVNRQESADSKVNEDWIQKYREETGSDVSFF